MIRYFQTARNLDVRDEDDMPDEGPVENFYFEVLARGSVHTDPEDMCDPRIDTHVLRVRDQFYARWLREALDNKDSVEDVIEDAITSMFAPATHCYHEHDCCGCRTGSFKVTKLGGAVFMAQAFTSRNY